jgi:hypothetical protein
MWVGCSTNLEPIDGCSGVLYRVESLLRGSTREEARSEVAPMTTDRSWLGAGSECVPSD